MKIYLMGGIGNILFQINAMYNMGYEKIYYNLYMTRSNIITRLMGWSVHDSREFLGAINLIDIEVEGNEIVDLILLSLSKKTGKTIFNRVWGFKKIEQKKNFVHAGYYQEGTKINKDFVSKIKSTLLPKIAKEKNRISNYNLIIHFRGGDYSKYKNKILDESFYNKIIKKNHQILVVTNDLDKASRLFIGKMGLEKIDIIKGKSALEDFCILAAAENLVIANSTFSWWAAEISNAEKIYQPDLVGTWSKLKYLSINERRIMVPC